MTTQPRPQPLRDAALDVTSIRGPVMTVITTLISGGIIGASTGSFLIALTGLIPGALALIATVAGAHGVVMTAEPLVTPVSDPRMMVDGQLVPLLPAAPPPTQVESVPHN